MALFDLIEKGTETHKKYLKKYKRPEYHINVSMSPHESEQN